MDILQGEAQELGGETSRREWDVIVIGAGVLGAFHAYFAAKKGLKTLLIERGELPRDGSVRNFGTLVPSAMTPGEWHERALESIRIYRSLAEETPIPLQPGGTQYLATTPGEVAVLREFARLGPERGYACQLLDARQTLAINPAIDASQVLASLHFPDDMRIDPRGLFRPLISQFVHALSGSYLPRTVVTRAIVQGGSCAVMTAAGDEHVARDVFICTGADFRTLLPQYFVESGMVRCKLHMLRTLPQHDVRIGASIASGLSIRWYPSFQMCPAWAKLKDEQTDPEVVRRGIHILLVQDADGRIVIGDSHDYSKGDLDDSFDAATESLILREARRLVRLPHWDVAERWQGVYAQHPERPLFRDEIDRRIHVVTGIGGKGMTTGPAVARESIDALR